MLGNNVIIRVSSPAKIILSGEHSVVYGHDAIAFAINLRCFGVVETVAGKGTLETVLHLQNRELRFTFDLRVLQQYHLKTEELTFQEFRSKMSETESQEELSTQFKITAYLLKYCPNWPTSGQSHRVSIHSDVPVGKCLGSSAAFNTVLATALEAVFNQAKLQQPSFLEQLFEISLLFERVEHGNPSGVDTFLSVYGGFVVFNKNKQPNFKRLPLNLLRRVKQDIFIGLIDSNIPKNTKEAVNRVHAHCNQALKYRQSIERIGQITNEIIRLFEQEGEWKLQLFELLNENHELLRNFGLSNDKIEEIVRKYTIKGHSSTKITGAGMGGYVLVVADKQLLFPKNKDLIQADLEEVGLIFTFENQCIGYNYNGKTAQSSMALYWKAGRERLKHPKEKVEKPIDEQKLLDDRVESGFEKWKSHKDKMISKAYRKPIKAETTSAEDMTKQILKEEAAMEQELLQKHLNRNKPLNIPGFSTKDNLRKSLHVEGSKQTVDQSTNILSLPAGLESLSQEEIIKILRGKKAKGNVEKMGHLFLKEDFEEIEEEKQTNPKVKAAHRDLPQDFNAFLGDQRIDEQQSLRKQREAQAAKLKKAEDEREYFKSDILNRLQKGDSSVIIKKIDVPQAKPQAKPQARPQAKPQARPQVTPAVFNSKFIPRVLQK